MRTCSTEEVLSSNAESERLRGKPQEGSRRSPRTASAAVSTDMPEDGRDMLRSDSDQRDAEQRSGTPVAPGQRSGEHQDH